MLPIFVRRSLSFQITVIILIILGVPILVMLYDIFYAAKTDQMLLVNKEERLATIVRFLDVQLTSNLPKELPKDPEEQGRLLKQSFDAIAQPLVQQYPGVRLGLYVPANDTMSVQGFLHNYRVLSPEEQAIRQQRIREEASSGIKAVLASGEPLARLAGSPDDQFFEHLVPIILNEQVAAVVWAEERLNPIFTKSRHFRMVTRCLTILGFFVGAAGALVIILNITRRVEQIRQGLMKITQNFDCRIPNLPGEWGQIVEEINNMAASLQKKEKLEEQVRRSANLASLGRLVTGIAHELRNPIGIIKASIQLMERDPQLAAGVKEYTTVIKEQVDRQNRVITELLEFGRPSRQIIQPLNLNQLLKSVLTFTEPLLRQHHITLQLNTSDDLPQVEGDGEKIKQVFVNLIFNAVQAMPEGGRLTISSYRDGSNVVMTFADTGPGIPKENLPHIFDPYFTTKETGSGLGLAICHQIVKLHDGSIQAVNVHPHGAKLIISLPVMKGDGKSYETQNSDH
ncbi:MAG: two-component sensor histidine kinase [Peptococcaceae bacterium]|nr:two-component sensor histidine kinase [Peptococcaceae bacterium]